MSCNSCDNCCNDPVVSQVPGPQGAPGADGADGIDGINAYTATTANFTMPAALATVSVTVDDSNWATIGQTIYIQTAGYMKVTAKVDPTHLTAQNLNYTGNAIAGTVIPAASTVSPSGPIGPSGAAPGTTLDSISPTTTKGDIIVDNGANSPNASTTRLGVGTNGQLMTAVSGQPTGLQWTTPIPVSVAADNGIPRFNGTSANPVPLQDSKLLITDDGAIQSTTTGGNARGQYAVDLQVTRALVAQVASGASSVIAGGTANKASATTSTVGGGTTNIASGNYSTVSGGAANTASGQSSVVAGGSTNAASAQESAVSGGSLNTCSGDLGVIGGGSQNTVSGPSGATISGGYGNTASGSRASVFGGEFNIADGQNSSAFGSWAATDKYGQVAHASGAFVTQGDAQTSEVILRNQTTDGSAKLLYLDGSAALLTVPMSTSWAYSGIIIGRNSDGVNKIWSIAGGIKNISGTVTVIYAASIAALGTDAGAWTSPTAGVGASGDLAIEVTGTNPKTINWVCHLRLVEVRM